MKFDDDLEPQLALFAASEPEPRRSPPRPTSPAAGELLEGAQRREGPLLLPSATVEWGTPPELVRFYADRWADGAFDLDVAASDALHVCPTYYTAEDDGLSLPWRGRVWVNPPYGVVEELWVAKSVREVLAGRADLVVALLPAKVGKRWWARFVQARTSEDGVLRLCYPTRAVDFIRGRVRHVKPTGEPGDVAGFPSVAILFEAWTPGRPSRRRSDARGQLEIPGLRRPPR